MVSFATYLTIAVVSMYGFVVDPFVGAACISEISVSAETASMWVVLYVSRGSSIVADTIVLVLTWIKTFGHWRDVRRANIGVSLTTCLLRDGTIYFIALLVINIAQPLTYNFSADLSPVGVFVASPVGAFVAVLPPVLINRFMINLRTVESEVPDCSVSVTDWQQGQSTLQFERSMNRLGNIGGPLYDGWSDEPYNDETTFTEVDETGAEV
ncbi:uncharacterized protein PHACADRAFT_258091 [Phanerochaete carnosa HHB-10118-sp]|uniref:Uncharacterized protein n=1 Tax=Phanerochaete carnosa (strain HHB-10118-sp) TaxID=650164 RepID=K5W5D1_PHACS|nr:uncharacterized protein PHACADRAFT_258091 [Phanerochaete carnosa HHB-10118-sp]EKM54310.1 hypothetical protein PHACADRAFT_258091 [Phanerochaete carnosa HHB-10118-sp]